jgi:uncharacterized protein (DUF1778 family)
MKNSHRARGGSQSVLKAIKVYANPEELKLIQDAAKAEHLPVSRFSLLAILRCAAKVLRVAR